MLTVDEFAVHEVLLEATPHARAVFVLVFVFVAGTDLQKDVVEYISRFLAMIRKD